MAGRKEPMSEPVTPEPQLRARFVIRAVGIVALLALLVVILIGGGHPLGAGTTAPDTAGITLDGGHLDLKDWRGDFVVVNVWATWCPPCLHEMPDLVVAAEKWQPKNVHFVGLAADSPPERIPLVAAKFGVNYPVFAIDKRTQNAWNAMSLPSTYILRGDGSVAWSVAGAITLKELDDVLTELTAP